MLKRRSLASLASLVVLSFALSARADVSPPDECSYGSTPGQACNTALSGNAYTGSGTCQPSTCTLNNYNCDAGPDGAPQHGSCGTISQPCNLCLGPDAGASGGKGGSSGGCAFAEGGSSGEAVVPLALIVIGGIVIASSRRRRGRG